MIESVGYTVDGVVWLKVTIQVEGQTSMGVLTMTPQMTREVTKTLLEAADKAESVMAQQGRLQ